MTRVTDEDLKWLAAEIRALPTEPTK